MKLRDRAVSFGFLLVVATFLVVATVNLAREGIDIDLSRRVSMVGFSPSRIAHFVAIFGKACRSVGKYVMVCSPSPKEGMISTGEIRLKIVKRDIGEEWAKSLFRAENNSLSLGLWESFKIESGLGGAWANRYIVFQSGYFAGGTASIRPSRDGFVANDPLAIERQSLRHAVNPGIGNKCSLGCDSGFIRFARYAVKQVSENGQEESEYDCPDGGFAKRGHQP